MAKGPIKIPRAPLEQPAIENTKKAQKRLAQGPVYEAGNVNSELDFVHERLNGIIVEGDPLADLPGTAPLADVITRLNALTQILREAGLLRPN